MPGPATILTTIGAVGACGAAVYVSKNHQFPSTSLSRTETQKRNQQNHIINNHLGSSKISKLTTTSRKMRLGGHRNDLHVLTFVMGKD